MYIKIVTPERIVYSGNLNEVQVPGENGNFVILPGHAPMLAQLRTGPMTINDEQDNTVLLAISGGYLEVSNNNIIILAEAAELADEIDTERAKNAINKAQSELKDIKGSDRKKTLEAAIDRAEIRLQVAKSVQ